MPYKANNWLLVQEDYAQWKAFYLKITSKSCQTAGQSYTGHLNRPDSPPHESSSIIAQYKVAT